MLLILRAATEAMPDQYGDAVALLVVKIVLTIADILLSFLKH